MTDMDRVDIVAEMTKDFSQEARMAGLLGAVMGVDGTTISQGVADVQSRIDSEKASKKAKKPRKPRGMTETESAIHDMIVEDCGTHMMDSGGDGGRSWQRNRHIKDFRLLSAINYEYEKDYGITIGRLLFHHLNDHLTYDKEETKKLKKWLKKNDKYTNSTSDVEEYIEQVYGGSEDESYYSGNTYNSEHLLSQDFQYVTYGTKIFISIHGGADIRGGYTDYKVFNDNDDTLWIDASQVTMRCKCGSVYSDDSGFHWYNDDYSMETKDGFPVCWKQADDRKLQCSECGDIVEAE
tara:strand:+ start:1212 stop:2093 length:882 start_codon:yes stop_codon:yes gene_type:complete